MPKSQMSRHNQINKAFMEQNSASNPLTGLHKQKLYALIVAGVGIIACILPWWTYGGGSLMGVALPKASQNGLIDLGWLSFFGFIAAGIIPFVMGDKTKEYMGQEKTIAAAAFGVAGAIALIQFLRHSQATSIGIFLAIIAGALGALWVWGTIKLPAAPKP
jgi:hypothetical protein